MSRAWLSLAWLPAAAFALACGLTAWLLRHPAIGRLADQPNARSSHRVPTPRGGGFGIVTATTAGIIGLYLTGRLAAPVAVALSIGALAVAAVGFWDDVRSAPVAIRMGIHFGAAILAVACLAGGLRQIQVGGHILELGAAGPLIGVLAIVWTLNLFNFMDGIDGIAASEAAFVLLAAAGIEWWHSPLPGFQTAPALIAAGACLGFLVWNWSPASIFMGDIGSGYLGYLIAVIALESMRRGATGIFVWLILGGVFFVDATLTLSRRVLRGEAVYHAHRTHAYQWLARRWGSHAAVSTAVAIVNVAWLLPCAIFAARDPASAAWICAVALLPLAATALLCGAGKPE
jgi:Fuc2NAc and GlcNAc transferase